MSCRTEPSPLGTCSATEPENVRRTEALAKAAQAAADLNAAAARLAEALPIIKEQGYWKGEFDSLSEYLAEGLKLKPSAANELVRVADTLEAAGIPIATGEALGFHKLAIVHRQLTAENREKVLLDLQLCDVRELKKLYQPPRAIRRSLSANAQSAFAPTAISPSAVAPLPDNVQRAADELGRHLGPTLQGVDQEFNALFALALFQARRITGDARVEVNLELIVREFLILHPYSDLQSVPQTSAGRQASSAPAGRREFADLADPVIPLTPSL